MSIRKVPNTEYNYYLVGFDENGNERTQADGSLLSRTALEEISRQPVTDMKRLRPGFRPVLVGWHWPSEPFANEDIGSFADIGDPVPALVEDCAKRLGDAPGIREELQTIARAHATSDDPQTLPPEVVTAYRRLDEKLGLAHQGEAARGAAAGADQPGTRQ